jgi:hypothetical protein
MGIDKEAQVVANLSDKQILDVIEKLMIGDAVDYSEYQLDLINERWQSILRAKMNKIRSR